MKEPLLFEHSQQPDYSGHRYTAHELQFSFQVLVGLTCVRDDLTDENLAGGEWLIVAVERVAVLQVQYDLLTLHCNFIIRSQ